MVRKIKWLLYIRLYWSSTRKRFQGGELIRKRSLKNSKYSSQVCPLIRGFIGLGCLLLQSCGNFSTVLESDEDMNDNLFLYKATSKSSMGACIVFSGLMYQWHITSGQNYIFMLKIEKINVAKVSQIIKEDSHMRAHLFVCAPVAFDTQTRHTNS